MLIRKSQRLELKEIRPSLMKPGVPTQDYQEAQILIHMAADIVGVDYAVLDHNLWFNPSGRAAQFESAV